jgi:anti-sigma factor RsiW
MTADVTHEDVGALLPWYVNGTATPEERRLVERHLGTCAACRADLALLREIDAAAGDVAARTPPPSPDGLARTLARIDDLERATPRAGRRGLRAWIDAILPPTAPAARWALAAQFVVILALGGVLLLRLPGGQGATLSGGSQAGSGTRLTVVFQPQVTEQQLRETLLAVSAVVVGGPSALGVYVIEVPVAEPNAPAVEDALSRLRARSDVVRFAEREP